MTPPPSPSQLTGLLLFTTGFLIAWRSLPGLGNGSPTGGVVGRAHQVLGTAVFGMACAQVMTDRTCRRVALVHKEVHGRGEGRDK